MRTDDVWLILDTETSGLTSPVYVVEIAAQRMRGWEREGEPFRVLLNHDVAIEPMAESVHGYSREFLRANGIAPLDAHAQFAEYAGEMPVVAYNLSYDWNRALLPEYQRLGRAVTGRRGFCAMTLSRRTICGVPNYKLQTLNEQYGLNSSRSHQGRNDVETLCALFERILANKLFTAGIIGFETVAAFSRKTPVAMCLEQLEGIGEPVWYYLDGNNQSQGPYTAPVIRSCLGEAGCYVWRAGMTDWAASTDLPEFASVSPAKAPKTRTKKTVRVPMVKDQQKIHIDESSSWLRGLRGVCKDIMADGVVTEQEFYSLYTWLISCPCTHVYPFNVLAEQVELILLDGVVTAEELEAFKHVLESLFSATNDAPAVQTSPFVTPDTAYYEVINLEQGSKAWLDWRHGGIGASDASTIMGENPWKSASQLLREKRAGVQASRPNAAMARGTALEPEARRKFIQKYGIEVQPACLQSLQHDWMRASLDGISKDGTVVAEIKCGESVYRQSVQNRCAPDYYYGQLQHILAVTGLPSLQFFCYLPGRSEVMLQIERDDAYIDQLIRAERDFWQKVLV